MAGWAAEWVAAEPGVAAMEVAMEVAAPWVVGGYNRPAVRVATEVVV